MDSAQHRWLQVASSAGSVGLVASGLVGVPVVVWLGPYLAMGLAIWSGLTTEPAMPQLGYPWLLLVAGLVVWGSGLRLKARGGWAILLTQAGAALVAALPWVHLWRLWGLTA